MKDRSKGMHNPRAWNKSRSNPTSTRAQRFCPVHHDELLCSRENSVPKLKQVKCERIKNNDWSNKQDEQFSNEVLITSKSTSKHENRLPLFLHAVSPSIAIRSEREKPKQELLVWNTNGCFSSLAISFNILIVDRARAKSHSGCTRSTPIVPS